MTGPAPNHVLVMEDVLDRALAAAGDGAVTYRLVDDGDLAVLDGTGDLRARVVAEDQPPGDGLTVVVGTTGVTARSGGDGPPIAVTLLPREPDVFDRVRGIFESDALKGRCVLFVGLGSGGSFVLRELVRSGVGRFVLIDHDRLDYTNVCRHELGLADVGRLKVTAMRDYVLDRNPVADVETHALQLDGTTFDDFFDICETAGPDLIVCGTDNRESRLLINRAALLQDIVALYGGVRRRAYAGQVVRVIPRVSPCYQCFIQSLPAVAADSEISSPEDAARVAYSDRPVLPEPGLSTDIAPVALLMAKLALVELTSDYDSDAFDSLRLDLVAPWFFWLNRREHDTPYAAWPPLLDRESGPGIMRWMGQYLERDESCPACGTETPTVSDEERAFFQADS